MTALDFLHARPDVEASQTVLWGNSAAVSSNSGGFVGQRPAAEFINEDGDAGAQGPVFLTHSTGDNLVAFQLAQGIVDRAEAIGHPYESFFVDAVSHGLPGGLFRNEFSPGVSVFQAQVNWLDAFLVSGTEG